MSSWGTGEATAVVPVGPRGLPGPPGVDGAPGVAPPLATTEATVTGTDSTLPAHSAGVAAAIEARAADAEWVTAASGAVRSIRDRLGESPVSFRDFIDPTEPGIDGAVNRAIAHVEARGTSGGAVVIADAGGVLPLAGPIVMQSGVALIGDGRPVLRLADGANVTMIESEGFAGLTGTTSPDGVVDVAVVGLWLDGNRANNAAAPAGAGHGVALYGRHMLVDGVRVENAARRGVHLEYTGPGGWGVSPYDARSPWLTTGWTGEEGLWNGASDAHFGSLNINSASQAGDGLYDAIRLARGARIGQANVWRAGSSGPTHRYSLRIDPAAAGSTLARAHLETGASGNLYVGGDVCHIAAILYSLISGQQAILAASRCVLDLVVDQAAPFDTTLGALRVENGAQQNFVRLIGRGGAYTLVDIVSSSGGNVIDAVSYADGAATLLAGAPAATDAIRIVGNHATAERALAKRAFRDTAIAGVGTTQAGAAPLVSWASRIYPVTGQTAFVLPAAMAGAEVELANVGAVGALIYPAPGQKFLHLAADAAVTIAAGRRGSIIGVSATEWAIS